MSKTLFMETTEIPPEKTIAEIEAILIQNGAAAVLKEYTSGEIEAVSFKIKRPGGEIPFRLPCRWEAIAQVFRKRKGISDYAWTSPSPFYANKRIAIELKAKRVAWRQILRWIEAQMALVQTDMVSVQEVFFPYIQSKGGKTLYELQAGNLIGLPSGE